MAKCNGAVCPEHPKWDQNLKFSPLSERTSILALFIWESPPGGVLFSFAWWVALAYTWTKTNKFSVNTINNRIRSVCLLTFIGQVSHGKHWKDSSLRVTKNSNRKSNDTVSALFRLLTSEGEGVKETKESAGGTRQLVQEACMPG